MTAQTPVLGLSSTMNDQWQLNMRKLYERGVKTQPYSTIVTKVDNGYHSMTYIECQQRATRIASSLAKAGIKIGDRVASFMWNTARHLLLYYAIPAMGAVLHTINIRLRPSEIAYLITHAQDRIIFADIDLLPFLEKVPPKAFQNIEQIVICGANMQCGEWKLPSSSIFRQMEHLRITDFEVFESLGNEAFQWPDIHENSAVALCYTSGTTGDPKGVAYSHRSTFLHTLVEMGTDTMNLSGIDCILPFVPFYHALGWGIPFCALTLGFKLLLNGNCKDFGQLAQMCMEQGCTIINGVPTVMQAFRQTLISNPLRFNGLRGILTRAFCGGSAPPADLIQWFYYEWKIEIIQAWGMTETNPLGTIARHQCRRRDLNASEKQLICNQQSCGLALPLVEMRIANSDNLNEDVIHDGVCSGELLVKGPFVTVSYFRNPALKKFHNGWLITGDISSISESEQMLIRDRSKDMIKSGGEWISSIDLENYAMSLPEVELACVVAVPHPKWDERPVIIVQLHENTDISAADVIAFLATKFSKFQLPDDVIFRKIPLAGTGKMSKKEVRKQLKKDDYLLPSLRSAKAKL